jgi:tripartite-type tricarboxylate transporter receptor subunit TctC
MESSASHFRHRIAGAAVLALATAGLTTAAVAADLMKPGGFPERTVSIIVPYGAGGGSDQVARAWATAMQKATGVAYQVENKPGGGGLAALPDYLARPKDGYTILQQTDALMTAEAAGQIEFKLGVDVMPICATQATFSQVYMRPDEKRFTDWKSFVEYAKKNPGQATVANIGVEGSMEVVQWVALEEAAGIEVKQISFDKPTERYAALIGGHTDILLEQPGDVAKFMEAGQMKAILNVLKQSPEEFKDTPSLTEAGIPTVPVLQRVRLFWTHKDVPADRRAYMEDACEMAFKDADYQKFNRDKYMHLGRSFYKGKDATEFVLELVGAYDKLYKKMGLKK